MRRCFACNVYFSSTLEDCPTCGVSPVLLDGFRAYAPEFAHDGGGFKSTYFSDLAGLEKANFWFQSRNSLILWALKKYFPALSSIMEVGCGTGFVLSGVSEAFPSARLVGSEIFVAGLHTMNYEPSTFNLQPSTFTALSGCTKPLCHLSAPMLPIYTSTKKAANQQLTLTF